MNASADVDTPLPPTPSQSTSSIKPPHPPALSQGESEPDQQHEQYDSSTVAVYEILRFIAGLRSRRILSAEHARILEDFLFENSNVLYATYTVAVSANDAEYFAEICRELAVTLEVSGRFMLLMFFELA